MGCGNVDFLKFDSKGEANYYASLALKERAGLISDLRTQVRFPLLTVGPNGLPCKFAEYVADYTYVENGEIRVLDFKPSAGMDPVAALKIRCMDAAGTPVIIVTEKD